MNKNKAIDKRSPDLLESISTKRTMPVGRYLSLIKSGELKRGDLNKLKIKSL